MKAVWLSLIAVLVLASCSRTEDYESMLSGNKRFRSLDFQRSVVDYLAVKGPDLRALRAYNLANAYSRLGEGGAALELYREAREGGDAGLLAWSWYNQGWALYEKGNFEESYRAFRQALSADPLDEDARRNAELAYRAWKKESLAPPLENSPTRRTGGGDADEDLRLLRRLETGRWRAGGSEPPAPDPEDY